VSAPRQIKLRRLRKLVCDGRAASAPNPQGIGDGHMVGCAYRRSAPFIAGSPPFRWASVDGFSVVASSFSFEQNSDANAPRERFLLLVILRGRAIARRRHA